MHDRLLASCILHFLYSVIRDSVQAGLRFKVAMWKNRPPVRLIFKTNGEGQYITKVTANYS